MGGEINDGEMRLRRAPLQRTVSMRLEASPGAGLVLLERDRQIFEEGWSERHDDGHPLGSLTVAALCYLEAGLALISGSAEEEDVSLYFGAVPERWPWEERWWKPADDPVRNLVKAGALIAAEIDRLLRDQARAFGITSVQGVSVQDDSDGV